MKTTKWITTTAVMIVVLVVLQSVTKAGGQFVTGSCVKIYLAVAKMIGGLCCGFVVDLVSPFFAILLGVGPQFIKIVPAISVGNLVYVLLVGLLLKKFLENRAMAYVAVVVASVAKFLALWLLVTQWIAPMVVPEAKLATISAMFSWPQLVTALIGGVIAVTVIPMIQKGLKKG